jgi:hypothetical protein
MAIFTAFNPSDITSVKSTEVTTGLWSPNETDSLTGFQTASEQVALSGMYYYDLKNVGSDSEVQFSVAYGHIDGAGSPQLVDRTDTVLPTKVIYSQYRNILLTSGSKFKFGQVESDDIYVLNFSRSRTKSSLDSGNWRLGLSGSKGIRTFTDNSGLANAVTGNILASSAYEVRSGSLGTISQTDTTVYGLVFPDYGVIILHPAAISSSVGLLGPLQNARTDTAFPYAPFTGSLTSPYNYQYQHEGLVRSIAGAMAAGSAFIALSAERVTSQNYFVRIRNDQYNYTNNPSYYQTVGNARTPLEQFKNNPITYLTTIGLYTPTNELVAVAKISRPIKKGEDREALIRVRLDY